MCDRQYGRHVRGYAVIRKWGIYRFVFGRSGVCKCSDTSPLLYLALRKQRMLGNNTHYRSCNSGHTDTQRYYKWLNRVYNNIPVENSGTYSN